MNDESRERESSDPEPGRLPRWVPLAIGIALVFMAGLAVYTGVRYRGGPLGSAFERADSILVPDGGAPGEPGPGASRMVHGAGGDSVPRPHPGGPEEGSRVVITGDESGVIPSIRLTARRAMRVRVDPPDALLLVNDQPIGTADQFSAPDLYEFPEQGEYTIRLVAPGHAEIEYVVSVSESAPNEVAEIETTLRRVEPSERERP